MSDLCQADNRPNSKGFLLRRTGRGDRFNLFFTRLINFTVLNISNNKRLLLATSFQLAVDPCKVQLLIFNPNQHMKLLQLISMAIE